MVMVCAPIGEVDIVGKVNCEGRYWVVRMDCRFASLFEKVDDAHPSSVSSSSSISSSSNQPPQSLSSLSESCLVALVMNAMQGLESSLITIQNISHFFSTLPPHTHNISSLWNRASTTHSFSKILHSIASIGSLVFLLRHFVNYFTNNISTLVNQAFAVALGKVLEGYISSLHTIHPSSLLRRSKNLHSPLSGCLNTILLSEFTLLEFYLHTNQLRTHIQALSTICNLHISPLTSFQDLTAQATSHFSNFYRGADLLTFLYNQLQVADPAHSTLLKFLFIRSSEPYCGFIRSWIFKAEINDPYNEFIVENMESLSPKSCDFNYGNSLDLQFSSIRVRDGVSIPAFLKDYLVPLVRAGQQLQVLLKLLGLCIHVPGDHSSDDFLPCWSGFSSNNPSHCSPLTFSRDIIEAMVVARESYYKGMNDKIESLLSSLEVRYQQVTHDMRPSFDNGGGTLGNLGQFMSEEKSIFRPTEDKARSNMGTDGLGSDVSSTVDDLSLLEDMYDSSESSSLSSSEEQLESDLLSGWFCPLAVQQNPLSALRFCKSRTLHSSIKNSRHHEKSGSDLLRIFDKMEASDNLVKSCHEEMISSNMSNPLNHEESSCSCIFSIQYRESLTDSFSAMGHLLKNSFLDDDSDGKKVNEKHLGSLRYSMLSQDICAIGDTLRGEVMSEDQPDNSTLASNWCTFQPQRFDHQCNIPGINPLSMNPMLTRNALLHQMGRNREKGKADHEQPLPYFNFSMVEDPCKVYLDKSPTNSRYSGAPSFPLDSSASTHGSKNNQCGKMGHGTEDGLVDVTEKCFDASSDSMDHKQDFSTVVSGGSSWERLLGSFRETVNCDATHKQSLVSTFEIPLDIIIDKCLLQEIMLQYKYVSKLIINVLEEAFELQEHLLALRRYHFMELADWADLFILSLWHHNWSVTEANERLSEIQGLLELSIQKSSCEQDPNKDRLFVYMKGNGKLPLSTSAIGVRSFEFLGLGYRLDWPLSIVLTPAALKIYADIFSFLIQVKLAIFSLTDVWCSLKDLVHTTDKYLNSELQQRGAGHLNILMKMRHQINHFVSTLQQYVESQLSHVSWCRFLHSLQYKVKDIMDLESVHMEYLADSLCICFLSDETRTVGSIIESILQCALDFRSCLTVGARDIGSDQEALFGMLSRINISQVLSIKQKFDRSLKELHICYINEPKHGNFGLSRFWEYLNYNEYYSHVSNEMGY